MPFALLFVGIVMLVAGVRGKQDDLYTTVKGDLSGDHNFVAWMVSILLIGALGYVEQIRPISRAFLVLLVIVLLLRNGGLFQKFNAQIFGKPKTETTVSTSPMQGGVLQTTTTTIG